MTLESVDVTLSFRKWVNGKGILKDVSVRGVRGVVDRSHIVLDAAQDPRSFRHEHRLGDFELDSFKLEDLVVTVHQPGDFRPFKVSLFSCDLPQLRMQYLFYDFLCANHISGAFDTSLFTIHPRQIYEMDGRGKGVWRRMCRIRADGVGVDHLNRDMDGPFGWITQGTVDIVSDIMFPAEPTLGLSRVIQEVVEKVEQTVHHGPVIPTQELGAGDEEERRFVVFDVRLEFHALKAAVPLFTTELSYINNALIRPIVAYMNNRRTYVPVSCRLIKKLSDFSGSWTPFDSGLMEDLSEEVYNAFAQDVADDELRGRRFRKIGIWSLQLLGQMLLLALPAWA
jgi:distribution and morphology protein 31